VYFPHQLSFPMFSEIPISFPFPELPFSILFPIKNMKTVMILVFTDRFRLFSSLHARVIPPTRLDGKVLRSQEKECGGHIYMHRSPSHGGMWPVDPRDFLSTEFRWNRETDPNTGEDNRKSEWKSLIYREGSLAEHQVPGLEPMGGGGWVVTTPIAP
jgi:hypothetical protein